MLPHLFLSKQEIGKLRHHDHNNSINITVLPSLHVLSTLPAAGGGTGSDGAPWVEHRGWWVINKCLIRLPQRTHSPAHAQPQG